VSELDEVDQAEVAFAAFDAADVVPVERGKLGEGLLRQASGEAQFADALAK